MAPRIKRRRGGEKRGEVLKMKPLLLPTTVSSLMRRPAQLFIMSGGAKRCLGKGGGR